MKTNFAILFLSAAIPLSLGACGDGGGQAPAPSKPTGPTAILFTLINESGTPIKDVAIESSAAGFAAMSYGGIKRGATESLKNKLTSLTGSIGLHWTSGSGARQYKKISLASTLGGNYFGPVTLVFGAGNKVAVRKQ